MKKFTAFLLALAFCFGFLACNGQTIITEDSIVDVWVTAVEPQNLNRYIEYCFEEGGKGSYRIYQDGEGSERIAFTYSLEDELLRLKQDGVVSEYETEYDGETLTLTHGKASVSLTREGK